MRRILATVVISCLAQPVVTAQNYGPGTGGFASQDAYRIREAERSAMKSAQNRARAKVVTGNQPQDPFRKKATALTELTTRQLTKGRRGRIDHMTLRVAQVVPDRQWVRLQFGRKSFVLTGYRDSQLVDGDHAILSCYIEGTGPVTYTSAIGATVTVESIRILTPDEAVKYHQEVRKADADAKREAHLAKFPVWISRVGSSVRARFVDYVGGRVTLETIDGRTLRLKISDFADADQERVREKIAESRDE